MIPWERAWQLTPALSRGEAHGQRSLLGFGSWGGKESATPEGTQNTRGGLTGVSGPLDVTPAAPRVFSSVCVCVCV